MNYEDPSEASVEPAWKAVLSARTRRGTRHEQHKQETSMESDTIGTTPVRNTAGAAQAARNRRGTRHERNRMHSLGSVPSSAKLARHLGPIGPLIPPPPSLPKCVQNEIKI